MRLGGRAVLVFCVEKVVDSVEEASDGDAGEEVEGRGLGFGFGEVSF